MKSRIPLLLLLGIPFLGWGQKYPNTGQWVTRANRTALIEFSPKTLIWRPSPFQNQVIQIDSRPTGFPLEGFGYTLTGSSARLIQSLQPAHRKKLLDELVGSTRQFAFFRLSIGASDLDAEVFDYHPVEDLDLRSFSLGPDTLALLPLLKEMKVIRPDIRFMATPWSPPVWMKTNGNTMGGRLKTDCYDVYARYLVVYLTKMKQAGVPIAVLSMQNEPLHGGNNPSMEMSADEQNIFLRNYLGPAIRQAGLDTEVLLWDHNADHPEYPLSILADSKTREFVRGTAFHLYGGDVTALGKVQQAYPEKRIYFTEQWTSSAGEFGGDLMWHLKNVVIGALRQGAVTVLEWNLANDRNIGPHTPGGCTQCLGALTIDGQRVERNVAYYILGQISSFVPVGSRQLPSSGSTLPHVFFERPDGKRVGLLLNETDMVQEVDLGFAGHFTQIQIPERSVVTVVW